jgi:hypothetical protein
MKWIFIVFAVVSTCAEANQTFTYEDLVSLIQNKNLKSMEEVLPQLPEDLRANYTLMYKSRALQQASYLNPRAILFGRDAKFILTFNGDQSAFGFETLETIQFRPEERSFDFRQIAFPTAQNGLKNVEFSQRNKTADGRVSCTSCHGSDPRPNWDHYSLWQGAYGGDDDELTDERPMYDEFVRGRSAHPLYKWLIQGPRPNDPYLESPNYVGLHDRPNLRLSDFVGSLNSLRAMRILEGKLKTWQKLGFAVHALNCEFSDKQKKDFQVAGRDVDHDIDMVVLFKQIGLSNSDWGTEILGDDEDVKTPWDHQSGFGFLAENLAMAVVQNLALGGNSTLQNALDYIEKSLRSSHSGYDLDFLLTLNKNIPYFDFFGENELDKRKAICPELTEVFAKEFLGGHSQ